MFGFEARAFLKRLAKLLADELGLVFEPLLLLLLLLLLRWLLLLLVLACMLRAVFDVIGDSLWKMSKYCVRSSMLCVDNLFPCLRSYFFQ